MKRIVVLMLLILGVFLVLRGGWQKNDFKVGIISPKEVVILSISPGRGMINLLEVDGEVELWIPGGMGWYQAKTVKKILDQEKNDDLAEGIFFYNFGFNPDKIFYLDDIEGWRGWKMAKHWGITEWLNYKLNENDWLYKVEKVTQSLRVEKDMLDEVLPRDFSDNSLQSSEIKMTVFNLTDKNGLGSFSADRLNWMGFNVVGVENGSESQGCEIMAKGSKELLSTKFANLLANIYKCSQISNPALLDDEMVLYLGQNYASMIKYDSYK